MQLQLQRESDSTSYYKMLLKQNESQNILIHDIKKHLYSISLLNKQNNPQKTDSYIEELIHSSDLQRPLQVCDNDLTSLFCNLLDNAVEAAAQQVNPYIELSVLKNPDTSITILTMENSCLRNPFPANSKRPVSTKNSPKKHGLGLKSIERIVQKHHGNMTLYYEEENKTFHTIITLTALYSSPSKAP